MNQARHTFTTLGLDLHELPWSPWKLQLFWHEWAGATAFLLVLAGLIWHPRTPLETSS